jgi:low affinity Fe/Cu permease
MNRIYRRIDLVFEKFTVFATVILGNSITFIVAVVLIICWFWSEQFYSQNYHECFRDVIHALTFLSLFIIQKAFNRFTASLHLKVNELVTSSENARNEVIHIGEKTEHEITTLSKEYAEIAEQLGETPPQIIIPTPTHRITHTK